MCGRYTQVRPWSELAGLYRIAADVAARNLAPRCNVAPTQDVPVVRLGKDGADRELVLVRWGLIPFWAKDPAIGARTINARAETVADKPSFRQAFHRRRCLVVADGFYEWKAAGGAGKEPYWITLAEGRPFAFAGLWERWRNPADETVESCTIIVTAANPFLQPIHDRMPAILDPDDFAAWLDTTRPPAAAQALLRPYPGAMTAVPVGKRVNRVGNDDPGCIEPIGPPLLSAGAGPPPVRRQG
jgi:putative SOS response-associated peptidase YedK